MSELEDIMKPIRDYANIVEIDTAIIKLESLIKAEVLRGQVKILQKLLDANPHPSGEISYEDISSEVNILEQQLKQLEGQDE